MLYQFATYGGDLVIDVNSIQSISPQYDKQDQYKEQNKSLENDNNHSVSYYVLTLANQASFSMSVETYKGLKEFLLEKGLLELAYEKDSDQEDAKEEDIIVQPEYTELKKALKEIQEKTLKEINELISSLDKKETKTVKEHKQLEEIKNIVLNIGLEDIDSEEALKKIGLCLVGTGENENVI